MKNGALESLFRRVDYRSPDPMTNCARHSVSTMAGGERAAKRMKRQIGDFYFR
jgi:hypothetical protein